MPAGEEIVEFFSAADTQVPVRLTTESVDLYSPERTHTPLMTYDLYDFEPGPPPEDAFRMKVMILCMLLIGRTHESIHIRSRFDPTFTTSSPARRMRMSRP